MECESKVGEWELSTTTNGVASVSIGKAGWREGGVEFSFGHAEFEVPSRYHS